MERLELHLPALYGDHHTTAVRGILSGLGGVEIVLVSPALHKVVVRHDPKQIRAQAIEKALAEQGYESGIPEPTYAAGLEERSTRQTDWAAGTGAALAFSEQTLVRDGRPLWPCPGFDVRSPKPVA